MVILISDTKDLRSVMLDFEEGAKKLERKVNVRKINVRRFNDSET